jgi:uncharacterized protein (DUF1810 family)
MTVNDPYELERFVLAQNSDGIYETALGELRRGHKANHWMWFVFPQVAGLGSSSLSRRFAIASLGEAEAYLQHRVLGPRLVECAEIVAGLEGVSAQQVFGPVDAQKLQSSMTLFLRASPDAPTFKRVLDRYFGGHTDAATDDLLPSSG